MINDVKPDVINVACIVLPDGQTIWIEDPTSEHVNAHVRLWRGLLPQFLKDRYEAAKVDCGVVSLRMLRDDYLRVLKEQP
jgi:hypothetical protein